MVDLDFSEHERTCDCPLCSGDPEDYGLEILEGITAGEATEEDLKPDFPQHSGEYWKDPTYPVISKGERSPFLENEYHWIESEALKELSAWVSDQGFEARIHAIFSVDHDFASVRDDYPFDCIAEFTWGYVIYTPVNSVDL